MYFEENKLNVFGTKKKKKNWENNELIFIVAMSFSNLSANGMRLKDFITGACEIVEL